MRKNLLSVLLFQVIFITSSFAALTTGSIAFTAFNGDGDSDFGIVLLVDVTNETVFFSDNELDGAGVFSDFNEGVLKWETGTTTLSAGTIIVFTDIDNDSNPNYGVSAGTLTTVSGNLNIAVGGEAVIAYQAVDFNTTPTVFLGGFRTTGSAAGDLTDSGLVAGSNFLALTGSPRGGTYIGATTGQVMFSEYLVPLNTATNWNEEDVDGELILPISTTSFTVLGGLPIVLSSFDVNPMENKSVQLKWQTASEENNEYFSIEFSTDGIRFEEIGIVEGKGTISIVQNYFYMHEKAKVGMNYYRLKQVDFDGRYGYSEIKTVVLQSDEIGFSIFPNPVSTQLEVFSKSSFSKNTQYQILNMQGQVILQKFISDDSDKIELDVENLPSGIYLFRLASKYEKVVRKFIKE